ncbi:universal stress protein [Pseudozobellia thermophila]|uniref:Nucleotide-binding universal stress protein, UspA family n=1 Tax=Pseudozobellia thermophila TaxID=192903 RepID=A0A1M6GC06_9FLAO|nr:universal stress protein [Pseudozobellia thermophila]SHJ07442.1 Nucleotide-binding universal stress protein, UspA family [Pseudozobellia thermophila]
MKKIIIPTDFSENAQKAIDYALHLFKNEVCRFYILHAYHSVPSSEKTKGDMQEDLNQLVKRLQAQNTASEHRFEGIMESDTVLGLTSRTVKDTGADYIFMGTKGLSALREIFVGSNTLDLIKYIDNCSIVMVPVAYEYTDLKKLVFATDFKHAFSPIELLPLIDIAKLWNATLNVVHIKTEESLSEEQETNKAILRNVLKGSKHLFFEIKQRDSVANTLIEIEKTNKSMGMMALLMTDHGFFQKLVRPNIIKSVAFKTEKPLIVLPQVK